MSDREPEFQEFQESEEVDGFDAGAVNRLTMLSLNSIPSTTTNGGDDRLTGAAVPSIEQCTMCGSTKRRSPSSSLQQPTSKKLTVQPSSSAVDGGNHIPGFTKLPLPITSPFVLAPSASSTMPALRRCASDLINSPGINNVGVPNPLSPENAKINASATTPSPGRAAASTSASLPPLPPQPICRSISDPIPSAYLVTTTPPPPSAARTFSRSPSSSEIGVDSVKGESPDSRRLKRMKACITEMKPWWSEVHKVLRQDEENGGCEDNNNNIPKEDSETQTEEAVSVEKIGECLIIHFKCPCGKGYQILLSGKNCYYKLM